ncbi:UbiE/COQ5 methyltransferase [Beauveria brongniartii RCEF 3172]|uniref:UbiE/COQ5 methyltransferase n=1 Tax=Beauveria brongniartii RCEF 3172 TaxID=1081107 RepID=A0A167A9S4_9HYPO|nr:UbiE/COQ5 methyltransferase [Beauveria brongniartii RCEF 3172]
MSTSTEANQNYFNKIAANYDQLFAKSLDALKIELQVHADFIGIKKGGRLLDYACGTGFVSIVCLTQNYLAITMNTDFDYPRNQQSLSDVIGQAVGVDITENMVGAYNAKAVSAKVPEDQRRAYLGNLLSTPPSASLDGPLFHGFDVAGVGMGFHHFEDTTLAAARLAGRLAVGGSLFVLDFLPHGAEPHHGLLLAERGVRHLGFDEEKTRRIFEEAGAAGEFRYKELDTVIEIENMPAQGQTMRRRLFLARGTKTAQSHM